MARPISPATEQRLLQALRCNFNEPITAYLTDVRICAGCALGIVHWDSKRRFRNGHLIRTSDINRVVHDGRYWLLCTRGRSQYLVVTFQRPGGRRSLDVFLGMLCRGIFESPPMLQ